MSKFKYVENTSGICTVFNEEKNIEPFIISYLNQESICEELIIVDGMSSDNTVMKIEKLIIQNPSANIKIIQSEEATRKKSISPIAKGRNIAIKEAKYDNIVSFDAGCKIDKNYTKEITKPLIIEYGIKFVAGFYFGFNKTRVQSLYNDVCLPKKNSLRKPFLPSSRSFSFKKKAWEKVGGYPELFITGEDSLFDLRLIQAGYDYVINVNAFVHWESPKTFKEIAHKHYLYGKGKGASNIFVSKFILKSVIMFAPIHCIKGINFEKTLIKLLVFYADQFGYMAGLFWRYKKVLHSISGSDNYVKKNFNH